VIHDVKCKWQSGDDTIREMRASFPQTHIDYNVVLKVLLTVEDASQKSFDERNCFSNVSPLNPCCIAIDFLRD